MCGCVCSVSLMCCYACCYCVVDMTNVVNDCVRLLDDGAADYC